MLGKYPDDGNVPGKFSKRKRMLEAGKGKQPWSNVFLTETIMAVMSQPEAIETGAAVVAWDI